MTNMLINYNGGDFELNLESARICVHHHKQYMLRNSLCSLIFYCLRSASLRPVYGKMGLKQAGVSYYLI